LQLKKRQLRRRLERKRVKKERKKKMKIRMDKMVRMENRMKTMNWTSCKILKYH
jgi:hypothetical protein